MNDLFIQQFIDPQMRNEQLIHRFILPFHRMIVIEAKKNHCSTRKTSSGKKGKLMKAMADIFNNFTEINA